MWNILESRIYAVDTEKYLRQINQLGSSIIRLNENFVSFDKYLLSNGFPKKFLRWETKVSKLLEIELYELAGGKKEDSMDKYLFTLKSWRPAWTS